VTIRPCVVLAVLAVAVVAGGCGGSARARASGIDVAISTGGAMYVDGARWRIRVADAGSHAHVVLAATTDSSGVAVDAPAGRYVVSASAEICGSGGLPCAHPSVRDGCSRTVTVEARRRTRAAIRFSAGRPCRIS
jgi:hypothetical protein